MNQDLQLFSSMFSWKTVVLATSGQFEVCDGSRKIETLN